MQSREQLLLQSVQLIPSFSAPSMQSPWACADIGRRGIVHGRWTEEGAGGRSIAPSAGRAEEGAGERSIAPSAGRAALAKLAGPRQPRSALPAQGRAGSLGTHLERGTRAPMHAHTWSGAPGWYQASCTLCCFAGRHRAGQT